MVKKFLPLFVISNLFTMINKDVMSPLSPSYCCCCCYCCGQCPLHVSFLNKITGEIQHQIIQLNIFGQFKRNIHDTNDCSKQSSVNSRRPQGHTQQQRTKIHSHRWGEKSRDKKKDCSGIIAKTTITPQTGRSVALLKETIKSQKFYLSLGFYVFTCHFVAVLHICSDVNICKVFR